MNNIGANMKMLNLLMFIFLILFFAGSANAIDLMPEPKLCNTFFRADIVVHAKVLKIEQIYHKDDPEGAPDLVSPSGFRPKSAPNTYRGSIVG